MNPIYKNDLFRDDFSPPVSRQYGTTKTYGLTYNATKWFAPYINKSDQLIPSDQAALDMFMNVRKDIIAKGTDFGARFNFLNGKLSAKYNYFNTTRYNNTATNNVITQINNLINANRWDDNDPVTSGSAINSLGVDPLPGNPDYSTARNFGYEIEISGQIGSSLRLTLNGSAGSNGQDNATFYPMTKQYMGDSTKIAQFKALLEDAGGSLDTTQKPLSNGTPVANAPGLAVLLPLPGKGLGLDSTNAVNAYNNIWIQYAQLATNATRTRRTPSANFFADYSVQSGALKGLRVGAGVQWQGVRNAGNLANQTILDPSAAVPTAIDDPAVNNTDIVWRNGVMRTQANLSYTFRLKNNRTLALALRVNNIGVPSVLYNEVFRQPQGDLTKPNRVSMSSGSFNATNDPLNGRLTATYSFGGGRGR
jgi:hypothetical protein